MELNPNTKIAHDGLSPYPNIDEDGMNIHLNWEELAFQIVSQNYGFVRMASAMARLVKQNITDIPTPLADAILENIAKGKWI